MCSTELFLMKHGFTCQGKSVASENPHEFVEKPLHSLKVEVWCVKKKTNNWTNILHAD